MGQRVGRVWSDSKDPFAVAVNAITHDLLAVLWAHNANTAEAIGALHWCMVEACRRMEADREEGDWPLRKLVAAWADAIADEVERLGPFVDPPEPDETVN